MTQTGKKGPKNPIAERTQAARLKVGLTQERMAQLLDVDTTTYAKWENRSKIPHEHIQPFCTIVHVSPDWLLTGRRWPSQLHEPPSDHQNRRARASSDE